MCIRDSLQGKVVNVGDTRALPEEARPERVDAEERGVGSFLTVPVRFDSSFIGYLHFECLGRARIWTDDRIELLEYIAEIFASGARRREIEAALSRRFEFEMRIADVSRRLLTLDVDALDDAVVTALGDAADLAGADRCYLLAFTRRADQFDDFQWRAEGIAQPEKHVALPLSLIHI